MRTRFLATTAMSFALATAAFAQSPNTATNPNDKPAAQSQPQTKQSAPSSSTSSQSSTSQSSTPNGSAQNSATGSSTSSAPGNNASNSDSHATPNANSTSTSQAPAKSGTASQAQKSDSNSASPNSSTQNSANPPASNSNQAQQAPSHSGAGTAQQGNTAQQNNSASSTTHSSSTSVNANVNINDQQRTRISQSVARTDVRPLTNVNFSLSVGTVVPRDVHLATLPADVVEIVPQYRGYSFVVVRDEIVIVEPSTYKIVATLPYRGGGSAAVTTTHKKASFSERDREVIRKHAKARVEQRTTGSAARTEIRVGERLPETVEIEAFPEEVYREAPELREYRYIRRESHTFVVDPTERTVIEEID